MGRIADALKKAEQERAAASGSPYAAEATAVLDDPTSADAATSAPEAAPTQPAVEAPAPDRTEEPRPVPSTRQAADPVITLKGEDSALIEQYRALRTRLSSQDPRSRLRVLAITSSMAGEGKSVTTANLGVVMSEVEHHQILLLDADFRRSSLADLFGLPGTPGLVEVLQGKADLQDVEQQTQAPNLKLISAGSTQGIKPAELLSSKRAAGIFDDLRDRYSHVLVDTPPSCDVADAGIVGQLADGVIMVVRMGKTPQPVAKQIVQSLQASQVNLLGCVLTGSDDAVTQYNYYDDEYVSAAGS